MPLICWLISPVAFAVCSASAFTSDATTAKPRPASPARAASMVAFNASRLVCPAMVRSEEHTSELQSHSDLVCRLLLEKKNVLDHRPHPPVAHDGKALHQGGISVETAQ